MGQVTLRGVHKRYGPVDLIQDVDQDVRDGECMAFDAQVQRIAA